jgi:transcriptional regulator with XRE-family HTH domain
MTNRIRSIRLERQRLSPDRFTLSAVALRLGVDPSTLWRWETGASKPTCRHARMLAKVLGVGVGELGLDRRLPC